jgi:hypothetical protein
MDVSSILLIDLCPFTSVVKQLFLSTVATFSRPLTFLVKTLQIIDFERSTVACGLIFHSSQELFELVRSLKCIINNYVFYSDSGQIELLWGRRQCKDANISSAVFIQEFPTRQRCGKYQPRSLQ